MQCMLGCADAAIGLSATAGASIQNPSKDPEAEEAGQLALIDPEAAAAQAREKKRVALQLPECPGDSYHSSVLSSGG
eukprot:scaffold40911_cov18-Tisochrysis_lutea.AAC.1